MFPSCSTQREVGDPIRELKWELGVKRKEEHTWDPSPPFQGPPLKGPHLNNTRKCLRSRQGSCFSRQAFILRWPDPSFIFVCHQNRRFSVWSGADYPGKKTEEDSKSSQSLCGGSCRDRNGGQQSTLSLPPWITK